MTSGPPDRITTALLLAAGTGSRLQPLTRDAPKCLTEIGRVSILARLIACLREQGFKRLVVVVGHLEHRIREFLAGAARGLTIEFVVNPRYRTTNNIYSLWLAREVVREPFLLLECDLVFDTFLLRDMIHPDRIAISRTRPWMNGTTVALDSLQRVTSFCIGADADAIARGLRYKTVNICSLSLESWCRVVDRLGRKIAEGRVDDFYETVFAEMVGDGSLSLQAVFFEAARWYEIDTIEDLRQAERIFSHELQSPASAA